MTFAALRLVLVGRAAAYSSPVVAQPATKKLHCSKPSSLRKTPLPNQVNLLLLSLFVLVLVSSSSYHQVQSLTTTPSPNNNKRRQSIITMSSSLAATTTTNDNADFPQPNPAKRKLSQLPKGVLFDMDGTLLDTEPLGCKCVYLTLEKHMNEETKLAFQKRNYSMEWKLKQQTLGLPDNKWPSIVLDWAMKNNWGISNDNIIMSVEDFITIWDQHMFDNMSTVGLCNGAQQVVDYFYFTLNIPLAIATSSRSHAVSKKRINHEGTIFSKIRTIVTTDDPFVKNGKPSPDIYLEAAKRINVPNPKDCVVFEDGLIGVKAGVAAGCYVIAIPDKRTTIEERQVFEDIADLVLYDLTQFNINMIVVDQQ